MTVIRVAAFPMMCFLLFPGILHAQEKKPQIPKVNVQNLKKEPEKYHGKVVQIEGILASDPGASLKTQVQRYYLRLVEAEELAITSYTKPGVLKGDRVLITGTFRFTLNPSGPVTLGLRLESPDAKVEKLPKKR